MTFDYASFLADVTTSNQAWNRAYPGASGDRQPVHTVYGGAQLFRADRCQMMGAVALDHLAHYAPDAQSFALALGEDGDDPLWQTIYQRVNERLRTCAVEDFRIDFEDGFGNRPDPEEDDTAVFCAQEVAKGMTAKSLPPFLGIRVKPLNEERKERCLRTLSIFMSELWERSGGALPDNFVVTLPKVQTPEQVKVFCRALGKLESHLGIKTGALKIEIMIELAQAIIDDRGRCPIGEMYAAAEGRCRGVHFGTYDFTASCDITAAEQRMDHPSCDFALHTMKMALAGRDVWLSDGATSHLPVPLHRGQSLSAQQIDENQREVHRAWQLSYRHVRHSLQNGYYQGWDLHPGQLPIRYGACYGFFLKSLPQASERLRNFVDKAAQATIVGTVFDDAATGQGLLNYFLRALSCGAISEQDVTQTGLTVDEVRSKSFLAIVERRAKGA